jgi:hypothetical protein
MPLSFQFVNPWEVLVSAQLQQILVILKDIENKMATSSSALADLQAQVAQSTSVEQSALTLINGLVAELTAAGNNPAAIEAAVTQLKNSASTLAAAVAANTTPAPTPTPTPTPTPSTTPPSA